MADWNTSNTITPAGKKTGRSVGENVPHLAESRLSFWLFQKDRT